jgi:hypothetical protein
MFSCLATNARTIVDLAMLGGEIIRNLDVPGANRTLSPKELILYYVCDEGGALLSLLDLNDKTDMALHMAYDVTCRKFLKFITRNNT